MAFLLGYQRKVIAACKKHDVVVIEKARRIGITWTLAYHALMTAKKGTPVFYIGYNENMTRDFIAVCADWARGLNLLVGEGFVNESDGYAIQSLKLQTKGGKRIQALSSRPRSLRGKQGLVIIDEAAFHDDLDAVLSASLPLLMLGGRMVVLSTHLTINNPFSRLIDEVRAGRKDYHLMRVSFADAIKDGYYEMVCKRLGRLPTKEGKKAYIHDIRAKQMRPAQELDCMPGADTQGYLPRTLLEECLEDTAYVARFSGKGQHKDRADTRMAQITNWSANVLRQCTFSGYRRFGVGIDVGRHHDLTVLWVVGVDDELRRKTVLVLELDQVAHDQQRWLAERAVSTLPETAMIAIDRTGIGDSLSEALQQRFSGAAEGISLNKSWYAEHWPRFKAALEDRTLSLPRDAALIDDLEQVALVDGIPRIPKKTAQIGRHADGAVAGLLAFWAASQTVKPIDFFTPKGVQRIEMEL